METTDILLDLVLTEEKWENLIHSCTCLETFNLLLQVKHRRILQGSCEKANFSIALIYTKNVNVELALQILKTTLEVAADINSHLSQTLKFCLDKINAIHNESEVFYALNLLNTLLEYYYKRSIEFCSSEKDYDQFQNGILQILKGNSKPLITFVLVFILPRYTNVSDSESATRLLTNIFKFVMETKNLEILCVCCDKFINSCFNNDSFNLIKLNEFWLLLMDCIVDQHHYLRKQAVFLLCKSLKIVLNSNNSHFVSQYLKTENSNETEKIWRNYLILLDVCNEKQLHIIEPSFILFESVKNLHFSWRLCLYKLFLRHSQNVVVYNTAMIILKNELINLPQITVELLSAINKNDYSVESNKVFNEIGRFCSQLDNNEFEVFLSTSLKVPWIPAAIWSFYSNIFCNSTNFKISLCLVENIINKLKLIPQKFIRNGCQQVVLQYFLKKYEVDCLKDIIKISHLMHGCTKSKTLFENFIIDNEKKIKPFINELGDNLLSENDENLQDLKIYVQILQLLKIDCWQKIPFEKCVFLLDAGANLNNTFIYDYVINKLDIIEKYEDVGSLLLLGQKFCSEKYAAKAFDVMSRPTCNNPQKVAAFAILCKVGDVSCDSLIKFWKNHLLTDKEHIDEKIIHVFVKYLLNKVSNTAEFEQILNIIETVLDKQNNMLTVTIIENLTQILKSIQDAKTLQFIERCFEELLTLIEDGVSKVTVDKFLFQMFQTYLFENAVFCKLLLNFSEKLLAVSNSANSAAYLLSKNLARVIRQNRQGGLIFIPIIVDLILRGIIISKNERVEYYVCQEIELAFPEEDNSNVEQMSSRLFAFECMVLLSQSHDAADRFVLLLIQKYMKHFSRRYFPDSQIHIEKMRILQAFLLLHKHVKDQKSALINLTTESFLLEAHQPSVKHLLQWLLISLVRNDDSFIHSIAEKIKTIANNRPSTVSGLIPVLYHLITFREESQWNQLVEVLLPLTMGAQFKLRIFSQVALLKLYEKALEMQYYHFLEKYKYLNESIKEIIELTSSTQFDLTNVYHEFLEYFCLESCDFSTIFYTIPKHNGVTEIEWANLKVAITRNVFKHIIFTHNDCTNPNYVEIKTESSTESFGNIQKKITPWKDLIDNSDINSSSDDFILVTSLVEKAANLGGLSRTCEVFGIKKIVMRTSKVTSDKDFTSLSMSSENWLDIVEVKIEDLRDFILRIKHQGYCVVGAEQTSESVKLNEFQFPKKMVLLLGNEKKGISADLIPLLDKCIEIPQFGLVRSLNVHVAGAIILWEYCVQQKL